MAQPTQDTDISSSFTPIDFLHNNDSSSNLHYQSVTMDEKNKGNVAQLCTNSINVSENCENLDIGIGNVKSSQETFLWINKFNKMMCSSVGNRSYYILEQLLSIYTQSILTSINTCCIKTFEIIKLKSHLNSTLIFFHFYWRDIKESITDHESYLNLMSELLELYIEMELKTFRHCKDSSKVAAKIFTMLWIYLSNSEKHIFRILLRIKLITKKYTKICDPIFMKSLTTLRRKKEPMSDIDYVRYLLVLKFWKKMKESSEEKKKVNKIALTLLGPYMPIMRDELLKIIPKPPMEHNNQTIWLLQSNVFDLKRARDHFLAFEEKSTVEFKDSNLINNSTLINYKKSQITPVYSKTNFEEQSMSIELNKDQTQIITSQNNCSTKDSTYSNKFNAQVCSTKKRSRFKKYKQMAKLKPGEVILIDLTKEDDSTRINKNRKLKKNKRKLEWLKIMRKRYKMHKTVNELEGKSQVEIADAHSTASSDNCADKTLLKYLPISDNKVSESTESCVLLERELLQNDIHCMKLKNVQECDKRNKNLKCTLHTKHCDICTSSLKEDELQHNRVSCLLKLLSIVGQNVKDPRMILNLIKEISSQSTFLNRNTANSDVNTQGKEEKFLQQTNSKECQSSITNVQHIKQELPTSTDYNINSDVDNYCENKFHIENVDCHVNNFRSISNHSSQITEALKDNISSCSINECTGCSKKTDVNQFAYQNSNPFNVVKNEDIVQNANDNVIEKKSISDKNIMCMLSDLDKCMGVLNRIGEHIMSVHAEKQRVECLEKSDSCAVSTTFFGDQIGRSSLDRWTHNMNALSNSDKLNEVLELYDKSQITDATDSKDFHKSSICETKSTTSHLEYDLKNYKQTMLLTSDSGKMYLYENNTDRVALSQNKLPENFICGNIKTEIEEINNGEDIIESPKITTEQKSNEFRIDAIKNGQTHFVKSMPDEKSSEDISNHGETCETLLSNYSYKTETPKTNSIDEFENIDILDSILNGDMIMEDEPEFVDDSQSSMMSPISYDNSTNVLNCITEFFSSQSEQAYTNKNEKKPYVSSNLDSSPKELPEGSLGTTGILNSLLDFDLTTMDSVPSDFMYSNIQTVNPRLIKKSLEEEIFSMNTRDDISELPPRDEVPLSRKSSVENMQSQRETKSYDNQKNFIDRNNVDIVGFGLNTSNEGTVEFPSLIKDTLSFSHSSSELKEASTKYTLSSPSHRLNADSMIDRLSINQKEDTDKQVQCLNDTTDSSTSETCTSRNASSNMLISTLSNQNDPLEFGGSFVTKQPLDSYDLLSSTDLISRSSTTIVSQCEYSESDNLKKQVNSHSVLYEKKSKGCEGKKSSLAKHTIELSVQSRSSKRKLRYERKNKEENVESKELPSATQTKNPDELSLRYAQLMFNPLNHQNSQTLSELPLSAFHLSYQQNSPHTIYNAKNKYKQFKCIDVQQLKRVSENKQILLNFHGKSTADVILEDDSETGGTKSVPSISEDSIISYKSVAKSNISRNRACFKLSRKGTKVGAEVMEINSPKDKHISDASDNIVIKSEGRWSIKNVDTPESKFTKKPLITNDTTSRNEETSLKKRKITKFLPIVERDTIVSFVNQRETQEKRIVSTKTDFTCTGDRRKGTVGE